VDISRKDEGKKRSAKAGSFGLPLWMEFGKIMKCIVFNERAGSFMRKG